MQLAALVALLAVATVPLHGALSTPLHDYGAAPPRGLRLARAVAALEEELQAAATVGPCLDGEPLLEAARGACGPPPRCLRSARAGRDVDLALRPLELLPAAGAAARACAAPRGGQRAARAGAPPAVAFVVRAPPGGGAAAARALVGLFRAAAAEAPSAEFVVAAGAAADLAAPRAALRLLRRRFGVATRAVLHVPGAGAWAARAAGAGAASAGLVAFVDPDAAPARGWLATLSAALADRHAAALAAPLFLALNASFVDAPTIIYSSGEVGALRWTRGSLPAKNRLAPADFVSGAAALGRRARVLAALRGLAARSVADPGDAEVGMALRAAGGEALHQPLAVALHTAPAALAAAAATPGAPGAFAARWAPQLRAHCPAGGRAGAAAAAARLERPRVLWLDAAAPAPARDSGSRRALALVRAFAAAGAGVTFLPMEARDDAREAEARAAGAALAPLDARLRAVVVVGGGGCAFDVVWAARRAVLWAANGTLARGCPGVPVVFDTGALLHARSCPPPLLGLFALSVARFDFRQSNKL